MDVEAYGLKVGSVAGISIQTEWPFAISQLDTITLYINTERQKNLYDSLLALHPKRIIFNPGTENPELEDLARSEGIEVLEACTLVLLATGQY